MKKRSLFKGLVYFAAIITVFSLFFIIGYILIRGIPSLNKDMFSLKYDSKNLSLLPALITTIYMILLTLVIAGPIGVFTGIYLVEYGDNTSMFIKIIRMATETLAGIPSILFGLFGMLFFTIKLGFQYSIISGVGTLTLMILPLIIRSTEEALIRVPDSLRMASYALGAGKLRTIFKVVLPTASPGILSGILLAIGRIVGETAALIYTLGTATGLPTSLMDSGRTLALHMYVLSSEGLHVDASYSTGVILVLIVLLINGISTGITKLSRGGTS